MTRRSWCVVASAVLGVGCTQPPLATPPPAGSGPEDRSLRVTILEYESAIEARDLPRLERIWTPTPDQRIELERLFRGEPLEVRIDWLSATHDGDLAIVDFDQVLQQGDHFGPKTPLTAALTPAPAGGWRIAFLGEREAPANAAGVAAAEDAPAAAPAEAPVESAVPPVWSDPAQRTSVARLRADLVRRQGGEWVIVSLTPSDREVGQVAPEVSLGADAADLHAALLEYERAFEERDADRLSQVWLMNPYERERLVELFSWTSMVDISIDALVIEVHGDRARLDFQQQFVMATRPRVASLARRAFVRALAASDAPGAWDIETLTRRRD